MKDFLRAWGPRLIGMVAGAIAGTIMAKTKGIVQVTPTDVVEIGTAIVVGYGTAHRGTSAIVNQGDAATPAAVKIETAQVEEFKAQEAEKKL